MLRAWHFGIRSFTLNLLYSVRYPFDSRYTFLLKVDLARYCHGFISFRILPLAEILSPHPRFLGSPRFSLQFALQGNYITNPISIPLVNSGNAFLSTAINNSTNFPLSFQAESKIIPLAFSTLSFLWSTNADLPIKVL